MSDGPTAQSSAAPRAPPPLDLPAAAAAGAAATSAPLRQPLMVIRKHQRDSAAQEEQSVAQRPRVDMGVGQSVLGRGPISTAVVAPPPSSLLNPSRTSRSLDLEDEFVKLVQDLIKTTKDVNVSALGNAFHHAHPGKGKLTELVTQLGYERTNGCKLFTG